MNWLKKGFKKILSYWYFLLLIIPLIIVIFISCKNVDKKLIIGTTNESYILINDDKQISIPLYINDEYSFYMDKKNISNIYLLNKDETNKYSLSINNIIKTNTYVTKEKINLTKYLFNLVFDYNENEIRIPDVYILLEYNNGEIHKLKIGSFIYINETNDVLINVHNFKGIVNKIIQNESNYDLSTVGVILNISSLSNVKINDIEVIHGNGRINKDQIVLLDSYDYDNSININELLDNEYRMNYIHSSLKNDILLDTNKILLLPISYNNLEVIDKLGILITYQKGEEIYKQIIYPMPIFNSNGNIKLNIYEYDPNK